MSMRLDTLFSTIARITSNSAKIYSHNDRKLVEAIANVIQRYIEVEEVSWKTDKEGNKVKTVKKTIKLNTLDNILKNLYALSMKSNGLSSVPPIIITNLTRLEAHMRTLEKARERFKKAQQRYKELQSSRKPDALAYQGVQYYLLQTAAKFGFSVEDIDPDSLWENEYQVFYNFLTENLHLILLRILPAIARDVTIPPTLSEETGSNPFGFGKSTVDEEGLGDEYLQ